MKIIRECSNQLDLPEDALEGILTSLAELLSNHSFVKQLLEINQDINNMAEDN